jgi:hypothetical protein
MPEARLSQMVTTAVMALVPPDGEELLLVLGFFQLGGLGRACRVSNVRDCAKVFSRRL